MNIFLWLIDRIYIELLGVGTIQQHHIVQLFFISTTIIQLMENQTFSHLQNINVNLQK